MGQSERVQAGRGEEAVREASHRFQHVVALQSKGVFQFSLTSAFPAGWVD